MSANTAAPGAANANASAEVLAALPSALAEHFDAPIAIVRASLLAGGASKEAWGVDVSLGAEPPLALVVRRAGGGVIYKDTLSLADEHHALQLAHQAGVAVPRPYGYLPDVAGRPAFVMARVAGETVGRRIVSRPDLAAARAGLGGAMAEQLARIHAVPLADASFLPGTGATQTPAQAALAGLYAELDALEEPHPAIELGLHWLRTHLPRSSGERVFCHGDFRVGNLVVDPHAGLVGVLDWEFAHAGDPLEDLAWPLVRAWRFGADALRLGGVDHVHRYLARYTELTARTVPLDELRYWELLGNVRWAVGSLTQARRHLRGEERSVELAVLGRLACEVEHEVLAQLEWLERASSGESAYLAHDDQSGRG